MKFAGILPYAKDARGRLHVLLGREAFGYDKGRWSGFAGRYDRLEESPVDVAAREGFEESMGLLGTSRYLKQQLQRVGTAVPVPNGVHFLLPVAYDPELPALFESVRTSMTRQGVDVTQYAVRFEKDRLHWTPFLHSQFIHAVPLRTGFDKHIPGLQNILRKK